MPTNPTPVDARRSKALGALIGTVLTVGITWAILASPLWSSTYNFPVWLLFGGIAAAVAASGYALIRSAAWQRFGNGVVIGAAIGLIASVAFVFYVLLVIGS